MAEEKRSYKVHLNNFDGPLDLLLHLIDKNQMDIYDIPIAVITEQYLAYLEEAKELDLEVTSEFLLIAATLLNIKAKMLLPKRVAQTAVEDGEDPRQELVQRLVEYRFYKETATILQQWEQKEVPYMLKPQNIEKITAELVPGNPLEYVSMEQLMQAYLQVLAQKKEDKAVQEVFVEREEYLVEDSLSEIRQRLQKEQSIPFVGLFSYHASRRKVITIFMALLELCRLGEITFQQQEAFGSLWIFRKTETMR